MKKEGHPPEISCFHFVLVFEILEKNDLRFRSFGFWESIFVNVTRLKCLPASLRLIRLNRLVRSDDLGVLRSQVCQHPGALESLDS